MQGIEASIVKGGQSPNDEGLLNVLCCERIHVQRMLEKMDKKLDTVLLRLRGNTRAEIVEQDTATEFSADENEKERPLVNISVMRHGLPHSPRSQTTVRDVCFEPHQGAPVPNRLVLQTPPSQAAPPSAKSTGPQPLSRAMSGLSKLSQTTSKTKTSGATQTTENASHLSDFATEFLNKRSKASSGRSSFLDRIHFTLDDPEFSRGAAIFHVVMPVLVGASIAVSFLQSLELDGKSVVDNKTLRSIDICFNAIFFVEVVIRFVVYPRRWTLLIRWSTTQLFFLVDLASSIPLGIFVMMGSWTAPEYEYGKYSATRFLLLCLVPQLRLLKLLRYMETLHLLSYAFVLILEALPSMVYVMMMIMWFFASLIVVCEPPENVNSLSHAMYLAILTMSTVGYGDVTPITIPGYIVVSVLVLCSILYTAMAFGLVGNVFTSVWKDRDRILLSRKMRLRLAHWGYNPHQIPQLFKKFDSGGKGELDVFTFREMIGAMRLCLPEDRINSLFLQFDIEGDGTIDAKAFVRHLFPKAFHELYGARMQEEELHSRTTQYSSVEAKDASGVDAKHMIASDPLFMMVHASSLDSTADLAKSALERSQSSHKLFKWTLNSTSEEHGLERQSPSPHSPQAPRTPRSPNIPS